MTRMIHVDVLLVLDAGACISVHCHLPLSGAMFSKLPAIKILMAKIINERLELQFSHSKHPNLPYSIRDRYLCESRGLVKIACVDGGREAETNDLSRWRGENTNIYKINFAINLTIITSSPTSDIEWLCHAWCNIGNYTTLPVASPTYTQQQIHTHTCTHRPNLISREISDINRIARAVTFNGNKWKKYV